MDNSLWFDVDIILAGGAILVILLICFQIVFDILNERKLK